MKFFVVGLGNPGKEYENSRHNTGMIVLDSLAHEFDFPTWEEQGKTQAHVTEGDVEGSEVFLIAPQTYMNKSGASVKKFIDSPKAIENVIVIYDDIDLPLGEFKISFNRGDGGHNGVASIAKSLNSKGFVRIRMGICPKALFGNSLKKPKGEKKVHDFLMGDFKKSERVTIESRAKDVALAIRTIIKEGREKAMNQYN